MLLNVIESFCFTFQHFKGSFLSAAAHFSPVGSRFMNEAFPWGAPDVFTDLEMKSLNKRPVFISKSYFIVQILFSVLPQGSS